MLKGTPIKLAGKLALLLGLLLISIAVYIHFVFVTDQIPPNAGLGAIYFVMCLFALKRIGNILLVLGVICLLFFLAIVARKQFK